MQNKEFSANGVNVELNPSTQPVAVPTPAQGTFEVTDARGRVITLKKPGILANLDFSKAIGKGADTPEGFNKLYLMEVVHLKYVNAIDGSVVPTPSSEGELRALLVRLDDDGNDAVKNGVYEHFLKSQVAAAESELKNS